MRKEAPATEDLVYEAIDQVIQATLRWERHPCRLHAADVAAAAGQVLLALYEEPEGAAYRAFERIQQEWADASHSWIQQ
jgi:hypothetical protein